MAVGPRVPAGVVALLQHELLPGVGLALKAQPPAGPQGQGDALPATPWGCSILPTPDLRARLHLDGAHLLHLLLGDVGELLCQLTPFPLEILQLIDGDLRWGEMLSATPAGEHPRKWGQQWIKGLWLCPSIPMSLLAWQSQVLQCLCPALGQASAKGVCLVKHKLEFCP